MEREWKRSDLFCSLPLPLEAVQLITVNDFRFISLASHSGVDYMHPDLKFNYVSASY